MSPGIDSKESILSGHVAWRVGTSNRVVEPACQTWNRFLGSFKVDSNEKWGGSGWRQMLGNGLGPWRSMLHTCGLNMHFLSRNPIFFSLAIVELVGDYFSNRNARKINLLNYNCANLLEHRIFLDDESTKIRKISVIRSVLPIQDMSSPSANVFAQGSVW